VAPVALQVLHEKAIGARVRFNGKDRAVRADKPCCQDGIVAAKGACINEAHTWAEAVQQESRHFGLISSQNIEPGARVMGGEGQRKAAREANPGHGRCWQRKMA
jgi:hypothetical protein